MTRPLLPSLLAAATVLVLASCSTDPVPQAPQADASAGSGAPAASVAPGEPQGEGDAVVDNDAVLEVEDQVSEGPTVNVQAAAVTAGGWVVVSTDGGREVLGAGLVEPGTAPALVQVSLADPITADTELTAQLYDDAVDDGQFGAGDRPVTNDDQDDDDPADGGETEVFTFRGADVVDR